MKCNNRHRNVSWYRYRHIWAGPLLIILGMTLSGTAVAGDREQAKRMHDRLTGTIATNTMLDDMVAVMDNTHAGDVAAARVAIENNPSFYNVTLKNLAAPWTNEPQTVFVPLNDYTATVIGMIRDSDPATKSPTSTLINFHEVLFGDWIYPGNASVSTDYSPDNNNTHYEELERTDLEATLVQGSQSAAHPTCQQLLPQV